MEHKGTVRIETERLILRPFHAGDGEAMYRNWTHDAATNKYLTWPMHENAEASEKLAREWEAKYQDPSYYQWAIELRELGEPIGSITVGQLKEDIGAAEVGYCIGSPWWGRGLVPEALRAVVRFLITEVGMNRVSARHDVENPNSGKVMQKAGMTKEGVLRASARNHRGVVDMAVWSILASEYHG